MLQKFCYTITLIVSLLILQICAHAQGSNREYYQLTIFHFASTAQENALDAHLKTAYIPALHRMGINNVGVFKAVENDTVADRLLYLLIRFSKSEDAFALAAKINKDEKYIAASRFYDSSYNNPSFTRKETIILSAFYMAPMMQLPKLSGPKKDRIYELRSYESPTDRLYKNKIHMFNEGGETKIFSRLNFNSVFYGEVISGSHMPNLMYMTSFENMTDRTAHWKAFSADADWKKLSAMPFYQHNVSHADIHFLKAVDYSDY